jgi:hypothetical protein
MKEKKQPMTLETFWHVAEMLDAAERTLEGVDDYVREGDMPAELIEKIEGIVEAVREFRGDLADALFKIRGARAYEVYFKAFLRGTLRWTAEPW